MANIMRFDGRDINAVFAIFGDVPMCKAYRILPLYSILTRWMMSASDLNSGGYPLILLYTLLIVSLLYL